jgi:signal transduction histidine kinase
LKIAIIGVGAIGGFVGIRLALAGEDVTFIARGANLAALRERGIRLVAADGCEQAVSQVTATDDYSAAGPQDLVILALKAHQKQLEVILEIEPGIPDIFIADPERLRQILSNLVGNAVKFTHKGEIVVRANMEASAGQEAMLHITVQDTGVGIPADELPRIWDRLYRGDKSRSERGLGLGLSLVRAIVEAHRGRVDVHSEPGRGSSFTVYLPAGTGDIPSDKNLTPM